MEHHYLKAATIIFFILFFPCDVFCSFRFARTLLIRTHEQTMPLFLDHVSSRSDTIKSVTTYYRKILSVDTFICYRNVEKLTNKQMEIYDITHRKGSEWLFPNIVSLPSNMITNNIQTAANYQAVDGLFLLLLYQESHFLTDNTGLEAITRQLMTVTLEKQ